MAALLIIALLLAWPTYGLSLIAWFFLMWFNAHKNQASIDRRKETQAVIEPLFRGQFAEFFLALEVPTTYRQKLTPEEAHKCGRHVMNYFAHNPSEAVIFMRSLEKQSARNGRAALDPIAAVVEGDLDLPCYRAILAIAWNNSGLPCLSKIDLAKLTKHVSEIESTLQIQASEPRWLNVVREWLVHQTSFGRQNPFFADTEKRTRVTDLSAVDIQNMEKLVLGSAVYPEFYAPAINSLPPELGNLVALRELHLQNNNLTEIPNEIGSLSNLRELKMGGNKLKTLPASIGRLSNLEILTIWNNELEALPPEIGLLKKLKGLSLYLNPLSELPDEITELKQLERLELESMPNLRLSDRQKQWISDLRARGCDVGGGIDSQISPHQKESE